MEAACSMFGHSPDFTSIFTTAFASAADEFGRRTRVKLFRLACEAAVPSFAGRQQLYEGYCSGEPVRLAGTLYGRYDKDTQIDRIIAMLDDLKARER
jgi:aromatic ring hydroxylase